MFLAIVIGAGAVVALVTLWVLAWPKSLYYRNQRPTRLGKLANRVAGKLSAIGLGPSWQVRLEVPGRGSGRMTSAPLVVGEYEGGRYLVSMLGPGAEWIKNAAANGGQVVLNHRRRRRPVRLAVVPVAERAHPQGLPEEGVRRSPPLPNRPGRPGRGLRGDCGRLPGVSDRRGRLTRARRRRWQYDCARLYQAGEVFIAADVAQDVRGVGAREWRGPSRDDRRP